MINKKQLIDNLTNKDLDNIVEMLESFHDLAQKQFNKNWEGTGIKVKDQYVKNTLDRNYNYSNILDYLNHVIPQIDNYLDEPNDETVLPISYETH